MVMEPLYGHLYTVHSVAFLLDGKHIISGLEDDTIRIWDTETGQPAREPWRAHNGISGVLSIAFSPDSKRLVSGGADSLVKIWNYCVEALGVQSLTSPGTQSFT
jgi:WD40 repeat protein